MTFSIYYEY